MSTLSPPKRRFRRLASLAFATCAAGAMVGTTTAFAQPDDGDGTKTPPSAEKIAERRQCMAEHGIDLPEPTLDENGRPERPASRPERTDEERAAFKAAAEACGLPGRGPGGPGGMGRRGHMVELTDEQKACLEEQGITKPEKSAGDERPAPRTKEQRTKFRAAAEACGIELPDPPAGAPSGEAPSDDAPAEGSSTSTSAA